MFEWKDVTDYFSEERRHWRDLYMEVCEVSENEDIECSLFSSIDEEWEIYFNYGIMHGVSYATKENARSQREQMKKDIEEEYRKHRMDPSDEFINDFCTRYKVDIMHAFF